MQLSRTGKAVGLMLMLAMAARPLPALAQPSAATPPSLDAPRGFEIRGAALTPDGDGERVHGQLCRVSGNHAWPDHLRLDTLAPDGTVTSQATTTLGPISVRRSGCVAYNIVTQWRPQPDSAVRLSAF